MGAGEDRGHVESRGVEVSSLVPPSLQAERMGMSLEREKEGGGGGAEAGRERPGEGREC
jgi:hypothetical protein